MSATLNPYGLQPLFHESGTLRPAYPQAPIASGYATSIYQNAPVRIDTSTPTGNLIVAPANGNAVASPAATSYFVGSFQGCQYTLTATGRPVVSNWWTAGTVATQIIAWYTRDPNMTYTIQANGSVAQSQLQNQFSFTANGSANGSTGTGFSTVAADTTVTIGTLANTFANQLRCVGFDTGIANAVGDAFTVLQVKIALHQDVALAIVK
jgi:hypothetical protein